MSHSCPGRCGRMLDAALFACPPCGRRLPNVLFFPIITTWWAADWPAHSRSLTNAMLWYANHPEPTVHMGEAS